MSAFTRRTQRVRLHTEQGSRPLERAQYSILGRLHDLGPLRSGVLAGELHLDPSTVSRHVAVLTEEGLVVREQDPADRRACRLRLTEAGHRSLTVTRMARQAIVRDVLTSWSDSDRDEFATLLEKFNQGLERLADESGAARGTRPPGWSAAEGPTHFHPESPQLP
nr:MarR family winged helix-turn-helix transcriptional regulator [Modestobacter muralis]